MRLRELLWRDFSRLSWRLVPPLRAGTPVVQALPLDDAESQAARMLLQLEQLEELEQLAGCMAECASAPCAVSGEPLTCGAAAGSGGVAAVLTSAPAAMHEDTPLGWLPLRPPPYGGGGGGADAAQGAPAPLAGRAWRWTPASRPAATREPPPGGCEPAAPSWASLLGLSDADAFEAWCVGRTGAPLVDAGMVQLWSTGWIPRRVRLLCAACLVEGLGLDWRLGRDWFAYTLTDHDYAINETMWQNAGLVGSEPQPSLHLLRTATKQRPSSSSSMLAFGPSAR